jgi:hypothetical protein
MVADLRVPERHPRPGHAVTGGFAHLPPEPTNTSTDADWQDYREWLRSGKSAYVEPEPTPGMTDAELDAHVQQYLADHDLSEVPF